MPSEVFELYLLLQLKDYWSGGLNSVEANLRAAGKEGQATLKSFHALREEMKQDLVVAGIGIGGLMLLRSGIKVAGDFEQAMTDLKVAIAEVNKDGSTNLAQLNDQMGRFQALGMRLGNTLPGSTQDFVEMFTTLKQGGMQTERILNGAGQAVANLAVVTHQNPAELGKEFAQFGEMFQLKTQQEWDKSADLFARVFRATGVTSSEMVQGLKFAQVRAGANIGLKGLEGASDLGRILGTLRTFGLEGGFGGRELSRFLMQLASYEKMAAKLKKSEGIDLHAKGIDLKFFEQGKFMGFDNVFKQLEKLRVLTDEERVKVGAKIFTAEGTAIATAFMTAGEEGWKKINDRVDAVLPLEQQITAVTDTWNTKLENIQGTLKNLAATSFKPIMDELKPALDLANQFIGSLQGFAQGHQAILGVVGGLTTLAAINLTVVGGIGAMTTAWRLWRIASSIGVSEAGQLTFLRTVRAETARTSAFLTYETGAMGKGAAQAGLYTRAVGRIPSMVTTTVVLLGIEIAIARLGELWEKLKMIEDSKKQAADRSASLDQLEETYGKSGRLVPREKYREFASKSFESVSAGGDLQSALSGEGFARGMWRFLSGQPLNPYTTATGFDTNRAAYAVQQRGPELKNEGVMRAFIEQIKGSGLGQEQVDKVLKSLQLAFPESYQKSMAALGQDTTQVGSAMESLLAPLRMTTDFTQKLTESQLPIYFTRTGEAATRLTNDLDIFSERLGSWQPGLQPATAGAGTGEPRTTLFDWKPKAIPSRAAGGLVERAGMVMVHDREEIVPARVTATYRETVRDQSRTFAALRVSQVEQPAAVRVARAVDAAPYRESARSTLPTAIHHHHGDTHVHVHIHGGKVDNPRELARLVAHEVAIQKERA